MDRLNALLGRQYRQYMNRMHYLERTLRWRVKLPVPMINHLVRKPYEQI